MRSSAAWACRWPTCRIPRTTATPRTRGTSPQRFIDTFDRLGIRPDRDVLDERGLRAGDDGPMHPRGARPRRRRARHLRARRQRQPSRGVAPAPGDLRVRAAGSGPRSSPAGMPGAAVRYECRTDLVRWATGCGHAGDVSPVRRPRQAAVQRRLGGEVVGCSASPSSRTARTSARAAAPATARRRSRARCSSASRR